MTIKDKILVVEDEKSISGFIRAILNSNGYDVIIARSGSEAFSMISSHCPDLVVLDRDIFAIPEEEIKDAKVEMTVLNGEIVFTR